MQSYKKMPVFSSAVKCSIYFQRDMYCILWWRELSGHWIEDERKRARAVKDGHHRGATKARKCATLPASQFASECV